jgi:hypothetical protein
MDASRKSRWNGNNGAALPALDPADFLHQPEKGPPENRDKANEENLHGEFNAAACHIGLTKAPSAHSATENCVKSMNLQFPLNGT